MSRESCLNSQDVQNNLVINAALASFSSEVPSPETFAYMTHRSSLSLSFLLVKIRKGRRGEREYAYVCVRTIPRFLLIRRVLQFILPPLFRISHAAAAAVEMWEIRSQMRIAAREGRFVVARTIKHGSSAKFGSIIQTLPPSHYNTNETTGQRRS